MKPNIELHIEELVLHGFPPHERHAIADAVRDELAMRLGDSGVEHARSADRLDAGTVPLPPGAKAAGRSIGGAVHEVLAVDHHESRTR
jgi:hypothetical protein